jgi:hypothetical protein
MVATITHLAHIDCPSALRDLPAWLCWRFEPAPGGGKPRKVPYYASGGRRSGEQGRPEDRAQLVTFDAARAAAARRQFDGVGFAPLADLGIVALDFDHCVLDGQVHPTVAGLLADTYAEFSPSGTGVRAFVRGQLGNDKDSANPDFGLEVFSSKGFVTFTGNVLPACEVMGNQDEIAPVGGEVLRLVHARFHARDEREQAQTDTSRVGLTRGQVDEILDALPGDLDYDTWVQVGMALHHELGPQGFQVWDEWSKRSPKYGGRAYGAERWRSFGKGDAGKRVVTARSLVHLGQQHGVHVVLNAPASANEFEALVEEVAEEAQSEDAPKRLRFQPIPAGEFASRPAPAWIIKGVIPRAELVVLFGESGSGKSFIALDLAACIARGIDWRGRRTRQGRVVYIAAEGSGGFRNRLVAYAQHHQVELAELSIDVIADAPNLLVKDDALDVARAIGQADVVIVDTFAQVTPGGNENAGEDMGRALAHCKGIHRVTGALVILVHHSGKDSSKGARGWSGLRAAADAELEVSRFPTGRMLRTSKQKDGDDDQAWGFGLEVVSIGMDEDGDAVTSCVVTDQSMPSNKPLRELGAKEQIVMQVVQELAAAKGLDPLQEADIVVKAVELLTSPIDGKRDTRRQHVKRALKNLAQGDEPLLFLNQDGTVDVA